MTRFMGYRIGAKSQHENLLPPAASLAAVCRAVIANLGMGKGSQKGYDGLYHSLQCCPGCPRSVGERSPFFMLLSLQFHQSLGSERSAQSGSNAHREADTHTHVRPLKKSQLQKPHSRDSTAPCHGEGMCCSTLWHCSGTTSCQKEDCTGPGMELQSNQEQ